MVSARMLIIATAVVLSACAVGPEATERQHQRAIKAALAYLAHERLPIPREYITTVSLGKWFPELAPSELVYVVDIKVREGKKLKTLYSVPINLHRMRIQTFEGMGAFTTVDEKTI
jgi:hypothetical protein